MVMLAMNGPGVRMFFFVVVVLMLATLVVIAWGNPR